MTYTELCIAVGSISVLLIGWLMIYLRGKFGRIDREARFNAYLDDSVQYYDEDVTYEEMIRDGIIKPDNPRIITGHPTDTLITRNPELRWPLDKHGNVGSQPKRRKYRDNKGEV